MDQAGRPLVALVDLLRRSGRPQRQQLVEGRAADLPQHRSDPFAVLLRPELERAFRQAARDALGEKSQLVRSDGEERIGHEAHTTISPSYPPGTRGATAVGVCRGAGSGLASPSGCSRPAGSRQATHSLLTLPEP